MHFPCIQCGLCCRMLKNVTELSEYDRGDGVCRYLKDNLCSIYEKRPVICNVDAMYKLHFMNIMDEKDYVLTNLECCILFAKNHNHSVTVKKLMYAKEAVKLNKTTAL